MNGSTYIPHGEDFCVAATNSVEETRDWQLVYTVARHEKVVAAHLAARDINHFLPLYEDLHHWGARSVRIQLPLFPCYVFVQLKRLSFRNVVTIPGLVSIVTFQGRPAVVADDEIAAIKSALLYRRAVPYPYLAVGERAIIKSGPLRGISGVVDRMKGLKIILSVDAINSSIAIEVEAGDLEVAA